MKLHTYSWRGFDGQSRPAQGQSLAPSIAVVQHQLAQQGIRMVQCDLVKTKRQSKLTGREIEALTTQLASLLQSGIPLAQALRFAAQGLKPAHLSELVQRVQARIESGLSLHLALSQETGFDRSQLQLIKAGELSGNLEWVLQRLSEHLQEKQALLRSVRSALNYPLIVGGVAFAVVVLVLTQVVPVFEEVFSQMGASLPVATQWLMGLSRRLIHQGPLWASGLALGVLLIVGAWRIFGPLRSLVLQMALASPVVGPLWLLTCQQRFASTLALLLEAGLPLTDSLILSGEAAHHPVFRRAGAVVHQRVQQGHGLAQALADCKAPLGWRRQALFPPLLVHLVSLGENSGQLDDMLKRWANDAKLRLRTQLTRMTDWLEPALIAFMGVVIGGLVITLYLPMFQMGQSF